MKTEELIKLLNDTFGFNEWPKKFEVDVETYSNVCQVVFDWKKNYEASVRFGDKFYITIVIGPHNGIVFKNVELILKKEKKNATVPST